MAHQEKQLNKPAQRWILLLCLLVPAGFAYNYDIFQPLQTQLQAVPFSIDVSQYNLLVFCTNVVGIFFTLLGGIFVQYFGLAPMLKFVTLATLISVTSTGLSVFLAYSEYTFWKPLLFASRLVFGAFGQTHFTLSIIVLTQLIPRRNQPIFIGLCCSLPWTFQSLNSILTPLLVQLTGNIVAPFLLGILISCLAVVAALRLNQLLLNTEFQNDSLSTNQEEQNMRCGNLAQLQPISYLLIAIGFIGQAVFAPFLQNANQLLVYRYGLTPTTAGLLLSITMVSVSASTPIWSKINNTFSKRTSFLVISSLFSVTYTLLLIIPLQSPIGWLAISIGLHGFSYSGYLVILFISIGEIEKKDLVGTVVGLLGAAQNTAMAFVPLLTAQIISSSQNKQVGYQLYLYFFLCLTFVLCGLAYTLFSLRSRQAIVLDRTEQAHHLKQILIQLDTFNE